MDPAVWEVFRELPGIVERRRFLCDREKIINRPSKEQLAKLSSLPLPDKGRSIEGVIKDVEEILSYRYNIGHPKFFSFIPAPVSPLSWLGDVISTAFNNYAGSSESGAGICATEDSIIRYVAEKFGLPPSAGGQFVSGASIASLTALTVARDQILDGDMRQKGVAYVTDETHFCISKALRITGLLDHQIRTVPRNAKFQMDTDHLRRAIIEDLQSGLKPYLVVATSGTTGTGSIDPLNEIGDIVREYKMWMHVDAAYGGSVAFCKSHRRLLKGLGRADSIAWDPHKWLLQTLGCSVVLFKEKSHPPESFAMTAHFLRDFDHGLQNPWNYGIELSRPARHMRLWFSLQVLGMDMIDRMISRGLDLATLVERKLRKREDWEIVSPSTLAILNFRFKPKGMNEEDANEINSFVSKELAAQDVAVIFTTCLDGAVCLRMCTINPRTTNDDIQEVVEALDLNARAISKRFSDSKPVFHN
ncbi:pyridoxal-dependent decarboxylase [Aspergillus ellipticus CBS 707.79]|uniref:Pyridoxal-dependent decarboxylase n=1 Tax=Aspergillus ellipticus CBS 707.79 TaxID=1448320 RepID=A0A319D0M8_9EURO|nr:pyridoxal-dependent decarboxylase [Aspergillus ellipticus CBS 707.79]